MCIRDRINVAATEELGKEVYHYHLHAMVLPVVEKEILWSKRGKDEKLRGTVKEVVHQISHSKKWKSDIPVSYTHLDVYKRQQHERITDMLSNGEDVQRIVEQMDQIGREHV